MHLNSIRLRFAIQKISCIISEPKLVSFESTHTLLRLTNANEVITKPGTFSFKL